MKYFFKYSAALLISFLFFLFIVTPTFAQPNFIRGGDRTVLNSTETINSDYFSAGGNVLLHGTVNGDVYLAGGNILVDGTVNGDLLIAGGQIDISGDVKQNIRVLGGNVLIRGTVGRNISVVGGSITIDKNAKVLGNLVTAGGESQVFAPVNNIYAAGGNLQLDDNVTGDVTVAVGKLGLSPQASIGGNLEYWSEQKANIVGGQVGGQHIFHQVEVQRPTQEQAEKAAQGIGVFFKGINFVSFLIIGLILIYSVPFYTRHVTDTFSHRFGMSLLTGFLTLFLFPFVFILLLVTVLGMPIAFLSLIAVIIMVYFAKLFAAIWIGETVLKLFNARLHVAWAFVIGLVIYGVITSIPFIGWIITLFVWMGGVGALLLSKKHYYTSLRAKKII